VNYRELTPRERAIYHLKNIGLAIAIGATLGVILAQELAR